MKTPKRKYRKYSLFVSLLLIGQVCELRGQGVIGGETVTASGGDASAFGDATSATGYASTSFGIRTLASGFNATAFGYSNNAAGIGAVSWGSLNLSGSDWSTVFGYGNNAIGQISTAFGQYNNATNYGAVTFGVWCSSTGVWSTSWGDASEALGSESTAWGVSTMATGTASTASGISTSAAGNFSTAAGYLSRANSFASFSVGVNAIGGGDPINWVASDPIFEVGNGWGGPADALIVQKNGNTTISGTDNELPNQRLVATGSILTQGLGDTRYVQSSGNVSIGGAALNVTTSGNVGIGTTTPNAALTVTGGSGATPALYVNPGGNNWSEGIMINPSTNNGYNDLLFANSANSATGAWALFRNSGNSFVITNNSYSANGSPILFMNTSGNVGIGTSTPSCRFEVNGNEQIDGNLLYIGSGGGAIYADNINTVMHMPTGGNFYMANIGVDGTRVSQSDGTVRIGGPGELSANLTVYGNTGLGTNSPQAKLDINGSARVSGSFIVSGSMSPGGTVVASGSNLALVPQQGDLSMGVFTAGAKPQ